MELSYVLNQQYSQVKGFFSLVEFLLISFLNLLLKLKLETSEKALKFQKENNFIGIASSMKISSILSSRIEGVNYFSKKKIKPYRRLILT